MPRPFVSVLIDTYNHERFIEEALASVVSQDFPAADREIVVVDDGSTDGTSAILNKFGSQLCVLTKPNGGQASAFNFAIPECRGEIVAFLDAEDWWAPRKLSAVVDAFESNPEVGFVGHGIFESWQGASEIQLVPRQSGKFRANTPEGASFFRLHRAFCGTSRMALRASLLARIGKVPEVLRVEADEYIFTLAAVLSDAMLLPQPLTYYRIHENNGFQIATDNTAGFRRKYQILAELAKALETRLEQENVSPEVIRMIVETVQNDSDAIRLRVEGGPPGQAFSVEMTNFRIFHSDASPLRRLLKTISIAPAFVLPARTFYSLQRNLAANSLYRRLRERWMPFSKLENIDREVVGKS
jgi:glycosyltransferase involved in cell wall biosynthesis